MHVFMPIIGKISEESHMCLITRKSNVLNGKQRILFKLMQMDASMSTDVNTLMVGKNKSTIHLITKCIHADKVIHVQNLIVLTTIQEVIEEFQLISFTKSSLRIEEQQFSKHRFTNLFS